MNNLLKNALGALQKHYCKILLINRKADVYYPVFVENNEKKWDKIGRLTEFAYWFLRNGNIYEQDKPLFEKYIKECFIARKEKFLFYRRKCDDEYRWAYLFLEPAENPDEEFLYVRDVNEPYIEQCDIVLDSVADIDPLTSFGNRYAYNNRVTDSDKVTLVKIRDLGAINAEEGYEAGDDMLARVASVIEKFSTDNYRLNGNTFALLNVNDCAGLESELSGMATVEK